MESESKKRGKRGFIVKTMGPSWKNPTPLLWWGEGGGGHGLKLKLLPFSFSLLAKPPLMGCLHVANIPLPSQTNL
ncbi:hypothetical protein Csa_003870, partial [Cucumis sativus]